MAVSDDFIEAAEREAAEHGASRTSLFDVRTLIGGLFVVYGILLTVAGLVDGEAARRKAAGIDINLWTGLGMLAVGVLFLVWYVASPERRARARARRAVDARAAERGGHG